MFANVASTSRCLQAEFANFARRGVLLAGVVVGGA